MVDERKISELHELVQKLYSEGDRAIKYIESFKEKSSKAARVTESVEIEDLKARYYEKVKEELFSVIERLVAFNCEFELEDEKFCSPDIAYLPVSNRYHKLKFLTGESPWSFWLIDADVDYKSLQKLLLKKKDLLENYQNPRPSDSICFIDRNKVYRGVVLQAINENRYKVLDCDSSMSKVINIESMFKVHPDASSIHASTIRCTLTKSEEESNLWTSDLKDLFFNTLKEATLNVKILEKLPGSFPTFLVDIEIQCEEDDLSANLHEWIFMRLMPEVKKLSCDGESVSDFLSSEVLNPYKNFSQGTLANVTKKDTFKSLIEESDSNAPPCDIDNTTSLNTLRVPELNLNNESDSTYLQHANDPSSPIDEVTSTDDLSEPDSLKMEVSTMDEQSTQEKLKIQVSTTHQQLEPDILKTEVSTRDEQNKSENLKMEVSTTDGPAKQKSLTMEASTTSGPAKQESFSMEVSTTFEQSKSENKKLEVSSMEEQLKPEHLKQIISSTDEELKLNVENLRQINENEKNVKFPPEVFNSLPQLAPERYRAPMVPQPSYHNPYEYTHSQQIQYPPPPQNFHPPHYGPLIHPYQGHPLQIRPWSQGLPHSIPPPRQYSMPPRHWGQQPPIPHYPRPPPQPIWVPISSMADSPVVEGRSHSGAEKPDTDESLKIANINNINVSVNVMAPEFVPKQKGSFIKPLDSIGNSSESKHSSAPKLTETAAHVKIRKPASVLQPGQNIVVLISHVVSPDEFYVNFVTKNNRFIDKLKDGMFEYYTKAEKVVFKNWREAKSAMGQFCAGKWSEDNHWYRVEVLDWTSGNNTIKVYFVDYGNTDNLPLSSLQPLREEYAEIAMCANLCHLAEVFPPHRKLSWPDEALNFFISHVVTDSNNLYTVTVVPSKGGRTSLAVQLYEGMEKTEESISINEQMVKRGLAWCPDYRRKDWSLVKVDSQNKIYNSSDSISRESSESFSQFSDSTSIVNENKVLPLPEDKNWNDWDPMAEEYYSARNNPRIDTDDAGVALTGYAAKDESRICKFYAQNGHCWKPEGSCTKEHAEIRPDGVTTDKEEVYQEAFSELALPSVGEMIEVKVTAVQNIGLFYVQLPEIKGIDQNSVDDEPETLSTMHHFMNSPENVRQMRQMVVSAALGQLVLALYEGDWYRARVIEADFDEPEVMFVDYGSVAKVLERDLREIEARYLHLPFQAIECSLANIIVPAQNTEQYDEGTMLLKQSIEGKSLWAKVYDSQHTGRSNRMSVLLMDGDNDLGELLISLNDASPAPPLNWDKKTKTSHCLPG